MGLDTPGIIEQELTDGNAWLIRLRWLAAAGIVLAAAIAAGPMRFPVPFVKLTLLGLVVAGYNAVLRHVNQRLRGAGADARLAAQRLADTQIVLDLLALAVLIHYSGGIVNPFAIYLVFHMIIAGILLPPSHAYAQAALASALLATVVLGENYGFLSHVAVFGPHRNLPLLDLAGYLGVMASALFIAAFLTITVSQKLRQRGVDLAQALDEVERQAQSCELANQNLQQTQEMQVHYMRRVSHELRAPLSSIGMTLRAVRDGLAGDLPQKMRDLVTRAEARTESLLDLVDDLLTLSRMREAPLQEPFTEVAVSHLVERATESMGDYAEQRGVRLEVQVQPGLPPLHGQPEALGTMLLNLVGNGIKYTPRDGQVTLSVVQSEDGKAVVLRVADTGIGISAADMPRLFDEFFRSEAARRSQTHGSGLGLSIVKHIVTTHDGEIGVESEEGKGTTFTVQLPVAGNGAKAEEA